jgi:hypothetical protein
MMCSEVSRPVAFSIFAESFLEGFTFPGVFSRARRSGAPTQVFASAEVEQAQAVKRYLLKEREQIIAAVCCIAAFVYLVISNHPKSAALVLGTAVLGIIRQMISGR